MRLLATRNGLELPPIVEGAVNFIYLAVTQSTLPSGNGIVETFPCFLLFVVSDVPLSVRRLFTPLTRFQSYMFRIPLLVYDVPKE